MAWRNTKSFNQSIAGKKKGYCLQNVRLGFGIASKYANAITAWNNTQQHKDRSIPGGDVPLFYTYKSDGHINVRLANGQIWNDGEIYANLDAYLSGHPAVKYLGWGESVNGIRVIEEYIDPAPTGKRLYFDPIGQTATFYPVRGGTFAMKIKDASYNWCVLEDKGNKVRINSASAGGDCWVYLKYTATGQTIPGRYVK